MTLTQLGYPTTALRAGRELLAAARRLSDPVSIGYALLRNATVEAWLRSSQPALEYADALLSLGTEEGMEWVHAGATFFRGAALAIAGRTEEGIAQMRQGISQWDSSGGAAAPASLPFLFASLAEALCNRGSRAEGFATVAEGMERSAQTGATMADAELYRTKGELAMIDPPDEAEAESCFRTAIDIARGQSARWFELRAATSLARLLKRQGRGAEARNQLSEIYNWFTEGFEFADLKDAKALLDEMGS